MKALYLLCNNQIKFPETPFHVTSFPGSKQKVRLFPQAIPRHTDSEQSGNGTGFFNEYYRFPGSVSFP
jgi:hypothetical protein